MAFELYKVNNGPKNGDEVYRNPTFNFIQYNINSKFYLYKANDKNKTFDFAAECDTYQEAEEIAAKLEKQDEEIESAA